MPIPSKLFGIESPPGFPEEQFQKVYWCVDAKCKHDKDSTNWGDFRDAWKAVQYHYNSCHIHTKAYTHSASENGISPRQPERFKQEHNLFGLFCTGQASLESLHYGLYAIGAILKSKDFSLTSGRRTPQSAGKAYNRALPDELLSTQLQALHDSSKWTQWKEARNILSHRGLPGRVFGGAETDTEKALWINLTIDKKTALNQLTWLGTQLSSLLGAASDFTLRHL